MDAVDGYIVCCRLATGCMLLTGANTRGSEWRCFVKKDVLKNFAKLTGKHLCQSLFCNKVAGGSFLKNFQTKAYNFIKKRDPGTSALL